MSTSSTRALTILGQADAALDGWSCACSTDCCRFGVTGREPWLTQAEWGVVVDEIARQGRRMPRADDLDDSDEERCPFLDHDEGRCTIYAARPLGCRTFFCEDGSGPGAFPRRQMQELVRDLVAIDGTKASRPLRSWMKKR